MSVNEKKYVKRNKSLARLGLAVGAFYVVPTLLLLNPAQASGGITMSSDPLTIQECSDCHPPYGPRYMRAYSWQKIMRNLDNHFGEDATLDEDVRAKIEAYLVENAGRPRKIPMRITTKRWFVRTHNPKRIKASALKRAVTFSNCTACHKVKNAQELKNAQKNKSG